MTIALHLTFPAGRYHGTAWGHHVNEGQIDWPPSPFRLLRALVAQAHRQDEDVDRSTLEALVRKLARPPSFDIPHSAQGHTRHYLSLNETNLEQKVRVLDGFVAVDPADPLVVQWEGVELSTGEADLLSRLTGSLTYLGRAESWCDAKIGEPSTTAVGPGEGEGEVVSLLALAADAQAPLDVLERSTDEIRKEGAALPRGTKRVRYFVQQRRLPPTTEAAPSAELALILLAGTVKPRITETVQVADMYRRALLHKLGDDAPSVITGRSGGARLADDHAHAHYLPFDPNSDGVIEYIAVTAKARLEPRVLRAMADLTYLRFQSGAVYDVRLMEAGELDGLAERFSRSPFGRSRHWISSTPFLLNRHPKRRRGGWVDTPEDQLRRELEYRGLRPTLVEPVGTREVQNGRDLRWLEFRRWRARQSPAFAHAFGFRITFDEAVAGPITAGFGAHFGLGMFEPATP